MLKKLRLLGCFLSLFSSLHAQTTLSAGDIAIIGVNYGSTPNYELTIVTLAPIAANTQIRISDYWYNESTPNQLTNIAAGSGNALTSEGTILWQPTAAIPSGTVYKISILQGGNTVIGLPGNVTVTGWTTAAGTPSSAGGDNWFIYQGTSATNVSNFVFLWGNASNPIINGTAIVPGQFVTPGSFNTTWGNTNLGSNNVTYLPPSLIVGTNAIALTVDPSLNAGVGFHADNNIYTGIRTGTKAALLAAICNTNNWNRNNTTPFDITPGGAYFPGTNPIFTVLTPCALSLTTAAQTNVSCNGGSNGTATVSPSGGTPVYTYSWAPSGGTAATATGLSAGTYTVTVTDANACTATRDFTITQPTVISVSTGSLTNVSCNGGSNGSASVTPSGGAGGYTYSWSPTGATAATVTGLSAGAYTVTVTDANSCTATRNFTITQPPAISLATGSLTNVSCNGGSNGTATVSPSGGAGGYTYSWSPSGGTAATASGLSAGAYTVTVTDANACTATRNFTITQPPALNGSTVVTNVACFGGSNGVINLTPSGGTPGYTFNWGGGITTEDRTGLVAGSYTCIITDANSCTRTVNVTVTQPALAVSGTTVVTNIACNGGSNGAINLNPTGGTGPYTFNWGGGITTEDRTGLAAGTYSVTITDANGCTGTVSGITVTQPTAISLATGSLTNVSCNGGSNGSASVTPSGGTPSYTYSWSPSGGTAATATGLSAGTYTVTVTDANSCTATRNFVITQPTAISLATGSLTNVSCNGGSNGTATVSPSGGAPSYTYSWSPSGGTAATATGLSAGTYTVTVTDANSCTATRNFVITQPTAISVVTGSQTNVSCNGGSNGTATVSPSGGTPGYTYSWSPSGGTAATATGLSAGTYTVTVTDANGCTATRNFTITQPTSISTSTAAQTNVSCNGGSNGTATVSPSGGTPGYTYSWSPSGGTAATATGLSAGTYTVTVTDANSCTATRNFTITQPTSISTTTAAQTNVSCNGGSNGSASVTPSGGAGGYTYSWSPSGGTAATATGLSAGTYTVTVTDANSCTATRNFTITQPTSISTTTAAQTNVSCNGGSNGSASVTPSGGAGGYTYSWSPSGGTAATATGLSAGTYTVTVTDANGCTATRNFTITQPAAIDNTVSLASGILQATQTGATYQWYQCPNTLLTGEINQTFTPTVVGDYKVEITLGGCTNISSCVTVTTLETTSFDSTNFVYYPNPTSDILHITNGNLIEEVNVINLIGQQMISTKFNSKEIQLNLSTLPTGTYFITINSEGKSKTIKILKQ